MPRENCNFYWDVLIREETTSQGSHCFWTTAHPGPTKCTNIFLHWKTNIWYLNIFILIFYTWSCSHFLSIKIQGCTCTPYIYRVISYTLRYVHTSTNKSFTGIVLPQYKDGQYDEAFVHLYWCYCACKDMLSTYFYSWRQSYLFPVHTAAISCL